jgi:integrase
VKARGREYFYYQPFRGTSRAQKRVVLSGVPYDVDGRPNSAWWAGYETLAQARDQPAAVGTFNALVMAYKSSPEWRELSPGTKVLWGALLDRVLAAWGDLLVCDVEARHVLALRDQYADRPAAANNTLRALSAMLSWSIPRGWRETNPCLIVRKLKGGEAYAPWGWEDIEAFRQNARGDLWVAAALGLFTGQRLGDVITVRWSAIKDGLISVVQEKTGARLWIPIHATLRSILAEEPRRAVTILANRRGQPWTKSGFVHVWRDELQKPEFASLRERRLVFHGLRKSAVVFLLEAGCTDGEVAAITGQSRDMVLHYAQQVNQRKLAASAVLKWEAATVQEAVQGREPMENR